MNNKIMMTSHKINKKKFNFKMKKTIIKNLHKLKVKKKKKK